MEWSTARVAARSGAVWCRLPRRPGQVSGPVPDARALVPEHVAEPIGGRQSQVGLGRSRTCRQVSGGAKMETRLLVLLCAGQLALVGGLIDSPLR